MDNFSGAAGRARVAGGLDRGREAVDLGEDFFRGALFFLVAIYFSLVQQF